MAKNRRRRLWMAPNWSGTFSAVSYSKPALAHFLAVLFKEIEPLTRDPTIKSNLRSH